MFLPSTTIILNLLSLANILIRQISEQPLKQAGFRRSFPTVDHIHAAVKQVMKKCNEYGKNIFIGLIDYNEAFDSIKHKFVLLALKSQDTP